MKRDGSSSPVDGAVGAQNSHQDTGDDGDGVDFSMDRAVLTGDYA